MTGARVRRETDEGLLNAVFIEGGQITKPGASFFSCLENVGDTPLRILIGLNSGTYEEIDLAQWMAGNPVDVLATNFNKPSATFRDFPSRDAFIDR